MGKPDDANCIGWTVLHSRELCLVQHRGARDTNAMRGCLGLFPELQGASTCIESSRLDRRLACCVMRSSLRGSLRCAAPTWPGLAPACSRGASAPAQGPCGAGTHNEHADRKHGAGPRRASLKPGKLTAWHTQRAQAP